VGVGVTGTARQEHKDKGSCSKRQMKEAGTSHPGKKKGRGFRVGAWKGAPLIGSGREDQPDRG